MKFPRRTSLPVLADMSTTLILDHMLNITFRGADAGSSAMNACIVGYLLQVQQAVVEYESARRSLETAISNHTANRSSGFGALFQASAHLESCINRCRRADGYLGCLVRGGIVTAAEAASATNHSSTIKSFRDAIEQTYEWIEKGHMSEGSTAVIAINYDGTGFGMATGAIGVSPKIETELTFADLADQLRQMHALARTLADYRLPASAT